jgi:uncharacterized alkaline shock family protein YloU
VVVADVVEVAEPGTRGSLTIRQRAVERIVLAASLHADGTLRHGGGLGRLAGRDLPRADVDVAGDRVRVRLSIAAAWGVPLADLAARVRGDVVDALTTHSGLTVDAVAIHVDAVVTPHQTSRELR